jgi:hypothetical protein
MIMAALFRLDANALPRGNDIASDMKSERSVGEWA